MKTTPILIFATVMTSVNAGASSTPRPVLPYPRAHHDAQSFVTTTPKGATTLYDQNRHDTGTPLVSADFGADFADYDCQGADDFFVPKDRVWNVLQVDVVGRYFNGDYYPPDDVNIFLYKDKNGAPDKLVASCDDVVPASDMSGTFEIKVPKSCSIKLKGNKSGTRYWLSVQALIDWSGDGAEWGWEVSGVQHGNPAMWQNYGGGLFVCPTWGTIESCLGYGPDFMFALKGTSEKI